VGKLWGPHRNSCVLVPTSRNWTGSATIASNFCTKQNIFWFWPRRWPRSTPSPSAAQWAANGMVVRSIGASRRRAILHYFRGIRLYAPQHRSALRKLDFSQGGNGEPNTGASVRLVLLKLHADMTPCSLAAQLHSGARQFSISRGRKVSAIIQFVRNATMGLIRAALRAGR
jgi:hypothetical protein